MPKIYEYFGLMILFYSSRSMFTANIRAWKAKPEIITDNGEIAEIRYTEVRGKRPLDSIRQKDFEILVENFAMEIVRKWIDYFVLHKPVKAKKITRKFRQNSEKAE